MILTYKIKHCRNFGKELAIAKKIANYAIANRTQTTKDVRHFGMKSIIANQILRKYARNRKAKGAKSVSLTIPNQGIRTDGKTISVPSLKLILPIHFRNDFKKINQIEIGKEYAFIAVSYEDKIVYQPQQIIGIDRNSSKHVLVASNISTGKVSKYGKDEQHIHNKYSEIRKQLQKKGKYSLLKKIKHRERNKIKDINHKISKAVILNAEKNKAIIVLESLKNIRKAKVRRDQRYSIDSWSFYQLQNMIEYKAKKYGVPIVYVEPQYTSQRCSRCGLIDKNNRKEKMFHCHGCGMVENADANAGFNIAYLHQSGIPQFNADRDVLKGSTDTPKNAMLGIQATLEPNDI